MDLLIAAAFGALTFALLRLPKHERHSIDQSLLRATVEELHEQSVIRFKETRAELARFDAAGGRKNWEAFVLATRNLEISKGATS